MSKNQTHTPLLHANSSVRETIKKISDDLQIKIKKSNIRDDKKLRNDLKFCELEKFNYRD